jgi:hypothetical protein
VQSAKPTFKSLDLIFYTQTNKQTKNPNCIIQEVNPAFCNAVCAPFGIKELKNKV